VAIDIADVELYVSGDPPAAWRAHRNQNRVPWVTRTDGSGYWAVTRYTDVTAVYRDADTFSSELGMRLDGSRVATAAAAGRQLVVTDPPRHARLRATINRVFSPRGLGRLESGIRATVKALVDQILEARECDFAEVAGQLPASVICDLLGVPSTDRSEMLRLTSAAFGSRRGAVAAESPAEAHATVFAYYAGLLADRRECPGEDIVSVLARAEVDGVPLSDEEVLLNCDGLLSGGNETTRHAATSAVLALIEHPAAFASVRDDRSLVGSCVEEILRLSSPALHVLRTPRRDVQIGGAEIGAGEPVTLWIAAANRDERVFEEPEKFSPSRSPNRHLTFGLGEHYCIGAGLARLELRILLEELLDRVGSMALTGPVRRVASNLVWGYEAAPVRIEPR
jgi:cytochrome P450